MQMQTPWVPWVRRDLLLEAASSADGKELDESLGAEDDPWGRAAKRSRLCQAEPSHDDDAAAATPVLPSREEVEPSPESLAMQQMLEETSARTDELLTCVCRVVVHFRSAAALTVLSVGRLHAQQHQEGIRLRWSLSQCAKKT